MAFMRACGFESGDILEASVHSPGAIGAQMALVASPVHTGGYALEMDYDVASADCQAIWTTAEFSPDSKTYLSGWFYLNDINDVMVPLFQLLRSGTLTRRIQFEATTRKLKVYDSPDAADIITGSAYALNQWHRIEYYCDNTSGSVYDELRLDGAVVGTNSGGSYTAGNAQAILGGTLAKAGDANCKVYVDDLGYADGSGSYNNDWLGDLRVLRSVPVGQGNHNDFTGVGPDNGTDKYKNWDEVPPDEDTSYNASTAENQEQSSTIQSMATVGLDPADTIKAIVTVVKARYVPDGGTSLARILVRDNSSDYKTGMAMVNDGTWALYERVDDDLPNGGGAWTHARADALEIGGATNPGEYPHRFTFVAAHVVYTPAAAAGRRLRGLVVG